MSRIDRGIPVFYPVAAPLPGMYPDRRASGSVEDGFVGGRYLPWWPDGASMTAEPA